MSCAWFIMTEVRANAGADFPGPPDAVIFVECSVAERNLYSALERIKIALNDQGFRVVDIDRCIRYDLENWDFETWPEDSSHRKTVVQHDDAIGPGLAKQTTQCIASRPRPGNQ